MIKTMTFFFYGDSWDLFDHHRPFIYTGWKEGQRHLHPSSIFGTVQSGICWSAANLTILQLLNLKFGAHQRLELAKREVPVMSCSLFLFDLLTCPIASSSCSLLVHSLTLIIQIKLSLNNGFLICIFFCNRNKIYSSYILSSSESLQQHRAIFSSSVFTLKRKKKI